MPSRLVIIVGLSGETSPPNSERHTTLVSPADKANSWCTMEHEIRVKKDKPKQSYVSLMEDSVKASLEAE
jgi:hypothetical protein